MYLGIDLGTSEVKALVIDENNQVIASHSAPLSIQRPHPHWSEQSPELWWEATEYLMATLREKCAQHWSAVKAIGLSGQMHGAVSPGDAFISLGTSGVLFVVTDAYRPAPQSAVHAFCHVLPNLWHQMSVMLSAASCLQWFCRLTGTTEVALLAEIAELSEEDKANAPFFLPYLSGERTPHNDPDARGIFWGMTHASLRAQLGYAVLEGVSFGINDGLQALKESGTPIAQCSLVGGGARSPFWAQLLADILAMPVVTHKGGETGGALGAARLACLAAGKPIAAVCEKPEVWQTWRADPVRHHTLMQRYAQFKALYLNDLHYRQH
ncbi:TPA: hypothetical protein OMI88_000951 [Klebsiella quasipneumoniae subsp. similipneumoniae]|nr:hypothetical protein [Klebsiella quasipneumoniae subsp. similipneumoniae]